MTDETTLDLTVDGRRWHHAPPAARVDSHSPAAIEELYRQHAPRFRRVAQAIVHDAETAEDVVQEAFAKALVRRSSYRGSGDLAAWLWRIVVNAAVSRQRRRRLDALLVERGPKVVEAGAEPTARGERLRSHVARLPKRQKLALFLHYYADLDYDTIGTVLAIEPGTVGKLLYDARTSLRRTLEGGRDA